MRKRKEEREGRGCVDQIFSFKMVVEKLLAKGKKLYTAFKNEEQGGFRKGRGCVDQIFSFKMVVEKLLAK